MQALKLQLATITTSQATITTSQATITTSQATITTAQSTNGTEVPMHASRTRPPPIAGASFGSLGGMLCTYSLDTISSATIGSQVQFTVFSDIRLGCRAICQFGRDVVLTMLHWLFVISASCAGQVLSCITFAAD